MKNFKQYFYNLKLKNSKLIWCIAALFMMLSFAMKVDCNDGVKKSIIALPKAESGIEKIEYTVNGEAKGSTDGINSIELEPGAKVTFAVKFEPEGYGKLHVRNIKIKSENGSVLRLNTYGKDDEGNFVLMRVQDSELINPAQTYISSDYIVGGDDQLSFDGIEEDKYRVKITDENNDVNLFDAVKLKYSKDGGNYTDAEFSENENAFLLNDLTISSDVKLMFEIKEGYTNSDLSLVSGENQIAINSKSKTCTLPVIKDDTSLEIRNLEKNSYDITFNEYTNAKFSCRIAGSDDEFKSLETVKVHHGDNLEIKCETSENGILESGEVTADGKALCAKNGVYILENIKNNHSIAVTPKASATYTISLPKNEDRLKLCDTLENEVSEIDAKQNDSVDFKIIPSDAYKKNFISAEMYAIPESKLSDGNYDFEANPDEARSFLLLPSGNHVYTAKNINEPLKIIAKNMEKNVYTVTLPNTIIGATAEVETSGNVTKLTENKFRVVHGSDFVVNLEAEPGYDLSTIYASDVNNSLEIKKDGNKYTFKNIDSDKYLIINGASTSSCKVSFDSKDIVATSLSGTEWKDNTASVKYQEGTIKFKVHSAEKSEDPERDISLSIKSGSGKLEKISSEKNAYSLSGVTHDIVLGSSGTQSSNVTITLKSDDEDIKFTDANDESVILPEENTVKYGENLNFKVLSKSGRSTDNISVSSTSSNPVTESSTASNTYSVTALRSGAMLTNTRGTAKSGYYVDLCENLYSSQSSSPVNAYEGNLFFPYDCSTSTPGVFNFPHMIVFSKDPQACECLNTKAGLQFAIDETSKLIVTNENYEKISESGDVKTYEIPLNLPGLLYNGSALAEQQFKLNFNMMAIFAPGDDAEEQVGLAFIREILQGKAGTSTVERSIPRTGSQTPTTAISEPEEGVYYGNKDITVDGNNYSALQYLQNCYCHIFDNIYQWVKLNTTLEKDATHNSDLEFKDKQNISDDLKISTYSFNGLSGEFDFKPTTSKFNVYLDQGKTFKDDVTEPFCLNDGAHAKLTQNVIRNASRCYVECTLVTTAFDESVDLKWSANSEIEDVKYNITFDPVGGIFRNSQGTESDSDAVKKGAKLIFYTEPQTGYTYTDALTINKNQTAYNVDDISKIAIGDSQDAYNGEWIKLSQDNDSMFIRATAENSRIKYEIAGNGEKISKYIIKASDQEEGSQKKKYNKIELEPSQVISAQGVMSDLAIKSIRSLREISVTFSYADGIEYKSADGTTDMPSTPMTVNYGEAVAFKIKAKSGYDISNIQVLASTSASTNILPLTNDMYILVSVTEPTTVSVNGIEKSNISLSFEQYDGIKYKTTSGGEYLIRQDVPYNEEIIFQVDIDEEYSQNINDIKVQANGQEFANSPDSANPKPYINNNLYIIPRECVDQDIKITISGLKVNSYTVSLKPSSGIKYYDLSDDKKVLPENNSGINYGNSFKFQLRADDGYDMSGVEVVAKKNSGSSSPITLIPANGVYTIENITSDYTVTVSGVSKQQHTVEFRTVTGVACLDAYGKTLPSSVTVNDGDDYSFYLSFDSAYSKSKETADVTIKGSNNKVPRDSSGKYTLSNIKENRIVEIINVTKNSYTATFVPAEGVIYRTAKGKEFGGTLNVEYGESLYFKISLLDAYDQSIPSVKMNGTKSLVENSGSYVLENISDDVTVTVENVVKNPEEVTIDYIQGVPDPVTNENDVNAVVAATKAYNSLSDDEKKLVTNKQALEKAQGEAGNLNHTSNGITISGVDWNVKLIVTPLSDNKEEMKAFAEEVDRRSLLSLYRAELVDLLTGERYSVPYGKSVQITMPCPDLTGYKNVTVAHRNLADNMEYLDPNIVDGTAKVAATSVGLFGIAAKEIPNYSENTSGMSISMGGLVSDDEELKTLLGEDLSSQLGHLIDLEDETGSSDGNGNSGNNQNGSAGNENSDSLLGSMAGGLSSLANSVYNWALDNELLAVLAVLLIGSLLILLILLANRKKDKDKEDDNLKKESK